MSPYLDEAILTSTNSLIPSDGSPIDCVDLIRVSWEIKYHFLLAHGPEFES